MSKTISLGEALEDLKSMFPHFDDELILDMLKQNRGHMENTVTTLLALSQDSQSPAQKSVEENQDHEIQEIEEIYGLNLHRKWLNPLPKEFLVLEENDLDELLAVQLQKTMFEQAHDYSSKSSTQSTYGHGNTPYNIGYMPSYKYTNSHSNTLFDEIKKKSKKWSNKVVAFLDKNKRRNSTNTNVVEEDEEEFELRKAKIKTEAELPKVNRDKKLGKKGYEEVSTHSDDEHF